MHSMTTEYLGDLRTSAVHLKSNNKIITDAPVDNNGKGEAFSPTDLVSSALSSCMMTLMGITASREDIDLTGLKANVTKVMGANPRKIAEIKIDFSIDNLNATDVQKEKLKRAALTCPVALSLSESIKQSVTFSF
ncbi:OsmC family protein [Fulvivirga kasyanovii]|uniref:OsmC family peroxiredoxin n=1 Tax=Fulvivirga kasyanovii TaxID=396812 RepID=A0ABW9RMC2_9BACT|nr:OsmC family protein [Fulvivirga kasyanovii]MTI24499.1 OsmC family peroxiredoxin [Fulvivirga kasyanovii]